MPHIEIYSRGWCPFCSMAKARLDARGVAYDEIDVELQPSREAEMRERAGRSSVPQIFVDGQHVGGHDDLVAAEGNGQLDDLLAHNARGVVT